MLTKPELLKLRELFADAEVFSDRITDWEKDFCASMEVRVNTYEEQTIVSEKQQAVLDRIERKVYEI